MSSLRWLFGCVLGLVLVGLLLPALAGCGQAPAPPPGTGPANELVAPTDGAMRGEKLPGSIRQAYEEAEKFGEPPAPPQQAPAPPTLAPWFDKVHYVGLSGALLLLAGLGTGLWIYLVVAFRRGQDRVFVRRQWRKWHYALGFGAGALALSHALGRFVQLGGFVPGFWVPILTGGALVLLVVSGLLRAWPPRPLARHFNWWTWSHRALTTLAVIMLLWHGITMYARFVLHP